MHVLKKELNALTLSVPHLTRGTIRPVVWLLSAALAIGAMACAPAKKQEGTTALTGPQVQIVRPVKDSTVAGWTTFEVTVTGDTGGETLDWWFDGVKIPMKTTMRRLDIKTSAYPRGSHSIAATLSNESGTVSRDEVTLNFANPDFELLSYRVGSEAYANGDKVELTVNYSQPGLKVSADFSSLDTKFSAASVSVSDLGNGKYLVEYPISSANTAKDARYSAKVTAQNGQGESTLDQLEVTLRQTKPMPLSVHAGMYINEALPNYPVSASVPAPTVVTQPVPLVTGASKTINLRWKQPLGDYMDRVLVAVAGMHGYYVVPTPTGTDSLDLELENLKPGFDGMMKVFVVPISASGTTSGVQEITIQVADVGVGGMQVTLFWDAPVDLDLAVIDPNKNVIEYDSPRVNGGKLNLDANALCSIGSTYAENISWTSEEALLGNYEIRVRLFDNCGYQGPIHWWIVGSAAATSNVAFKPGAGGAGSTIAVTSGQDSGGTLNNGVKYYGTINSNDTTASDVGGIVAGPPVAAEPSQVVGGTISYENNKIGAFGEVPARFVPVRIVSAADPNAILGQSSTDEDGKYSIRLHNPNNLAYKLVVEAAYSESGGAVAQLTVTDFVGNEVHSASTPEFASKRDTAVRLDFVILHGNKSGAFNIIENMRLGYVWARSKRAGLPLRPVTAHWAPGAVSETWYLEKKATIEFSGSQDDPDEFDDSVIIHEFNHHIYRELLGHGAAGGQHNFGNRILAEKAFSEGEATAFGQHILNSPEYIDKKRGNTVVGLTNVEDDPRIQAQYQEQNDDVSELLVAMVLWDLMDGSGQSPEPHDLISGPLMTENAFFWGLTGRPDRGPANLDLVDFLDAWRCPCNSMDANQAGVYTHELQQLLDERKYVYDFAPTTYCPQPAAPPPTW